jgi:hypothetical protein
LTIGQKCPFRQGASGVRGGKDSFCLEDYEDYGGLWRIMEDYGELWGLLSFRL